MYRLSLKDIHLDESIALLPKSDPVALLDDFVVKQDRISPQNKRFLPSSTLLAHC